MSKYVALIDDVFGVVSVAPVERVEHQLAQLMSGLHFAGDVERSIRAGELAEGGPLVARRRALIRTAYHRTMVESAVDEWRRRHG